MRKPPALIRGGTVTWIAAQEFLAAVEKGGEKAAGLLRVVRLGRSHHDQQLSEDAPRHDKAPQPWGAGMCIMEVACMGTTVVHVGAATGAFGPARSDHSAHRLAC